MLQQSDLPTLTTLYRSSSLPPSSSSPFYPPSSSLNSRISLIRADITTLSLPNGCIVNAAKQSLRGGGGVDGVIHNAAGPGLLEECITLGGCETGDAKITGAYELPVKRIVHTVGPVWWASGEGEARELLGSCYRTSLKLAVENGLDAIAFPAVSTGIYGYPSDKAARVALETTRKFLESKEAEGLQLVVFCNFLEKDEKVYKELIPLYFPPADEEVKDEGKEEKKKAEEKEATDKKEEAAEEKKDTEENKDTEDKTDTKEKKE
ncbi:hypothetical protein FPQ18DRAFT_367370 [Pyronema domesticum]|nr:hypothetical protein FPQ18DRAFT_367370 [Pyronema domesticum]